MASSSGLVRTAAARQALHHDEELAGIEYSGIAGASKDCQDAVMRLLQFGDQITRVRILTHSKKRAPSKHCLLLTYNVGDVIAIRSGFSSGYGGEGPRRFSYTLQLLDSHGAEIEEYEVDEDLLNRVDRATVRRADLDALDNAKPVRPTRWHDYIDEKDYDRGRNGRLWADFPPVIPFAIIDSRIMDLALLFWEDPDARLLKGYRRLEDLVRERTGISANTSRLFSQAFIGPTSKLYWEGMDDGESTSRGNLFTAVCGAYRNPRAHRELKSYSHAQLAEFLLLNHLYRLEKEAVVRSA